MRNETVKTNAQTTVNQSEQADESRPLLEQATLGEVEKNRDFFDNLNNKNKHRFFLSKYAERNFPADLLLDSIDNFDSIDPGTVEMYADNIDDDQPNFDDTVDVLCRIRSFDVNHYKEQFKKHKSRTKQSDKTNKQRIAELTDQVEQLTDLVEKQSRKLDQIVNNV